MRSRTLRFYDELLFRTRRMRLGPHAMFSTVYFYDSPRELEREGCARTAGGEGRPPGNTEVSFDPENAVDDDGKLFGDCYARFDLCRRRPRPRFWPRALGMTDKTAIRLFQKSPGGDGGGHLGGKSQPRSASERIGGKAAAGRRGKLPRACRTGPEVELDDGAGIRETRQRGRGHVGVAHSPLSLSLPRSNFTRRRSRRRRRP